MKITWVRQVKPQKKDAKDKTVEVDKDGKPKKPVEEGKSPEPGATTSVGTKEEEEAKWVFTVVPESVVLNPKMGIMVEFRANST